MILYYTIQNYIILYYVTLYYIILLLYYIILYYNIIYYINIILYYINIILYYIILYYIIYIHTSLQSNALWSLRVASGDLKWQCKFERLQIAYSTWELCCQGPKPRCSKSKDHWIVPLGAMGCWTQMTWKWELNKGNDGDVIGVHVRIIPIPQSLRKWWSTMLRHQLRAQDLAYKVTTKDQDALVEEHCWVALQYTRFVPHDYLGVIRVATGWNGKSIFLRNHTMK